MGGGLRSANAYNSPHRHSLSVCQVRERRETRNSKIGVHKPSWDNNRGILYNVKCKKTVFPSNNIIPTLDNANSGTDKRTEAVPSLVNRWLPGNCCERSDLGVRYGPAGDHSPRAKCLASYTML
jgi:hypothetical protein